MQKKRSKTLTRYKATSKLQPAEDKEPEKIGEDSIPKSTAVYTRLNVEPVRAVPESNAHWCPLFGPLQEPKSLHFVAGPRLVRIIETARVIWDVYRDRPGEVDPYPPESLESARFIFLTLIRDHQEKPSSKNEWPFLKWDRRVHGNIDRDVPESRMYAILGLTQAWIALRAVVQNKRLGYSPSLCDYIDKSEKLISLAESLRESERLMEALNSAEELERRLKKGAVATKQKMNERKENCLREIDAHLKEHPEDRDNKKKMVLEVAEKIGVHESSVWRYIRK